MLIGVVAALAAELRCLGRIGGAALRARQAGPGRVRAAAAARALLAEGCEGLASWGVAGGLAEPLAAGDLLLASAVVESGGRRWDCDAAWRSALRAALPPALTVHEGLLAHSDRPLADADAKAARHAQDGSLAVDMESAAVAAVAAEAGVPFIALRAISDDRRRALPDAALRAMGDDGRARPLALAAALLRRPLDALRLPPLARGFGRARRSLRRAAPGLLGSAQPGAPARARGTGTLTSLPMGN